MVHRLINAPNPILEVETQESPAQHEDHQDSAATTIPTTNTTSNIPLPTHVEINGREIPYPEGWGGMRNPNATLRSRTAVRWETIARLIVDPRAWYDDTAMWLSMLLVAINSGQRAAVLDPGYTNMWQYDQEIRQQQRRSQRQGNPNAQEQPVLNLSARRHADGVVENPDIIAIPLFMRPNHWVLGIYTRADHTTRYYDTLGTPLSSRIRRQLIAVVEEFYPNDPDTLIQSVAINEYNRQIDSYNCGPHCLLIWESFMAPDRNTLISPINMEHERLRLLSNLIGAYIDDNQPFTPLHPREEPYPPLRDYLSILPFSEIIAPAQGEPEPPDEEEGELISHWHGGGIEIDPVEENNNSTTNDGPAPNLSQEDATTFYTDAELPDNRDQLAAVIQRLCNINTEQITEFANSSVLDGSLIDAYLCMLETLRRCRAAIIRTAYSRNWSQNRRSSDYTYGDLSNLDIVIVPILKSSHESINHYALGVYNAQSGSLFHYDSLGTQASLHDKMVYRAAIQTLRPIGEPQLTCKKVINRVLQSYNQQGDPVLSGLYTTLLAELILLRGSDRTYLKRLGDQRHETSERELQIHRVIGHLMYLANGVFPLYTAPPKSQKRVPVSQFQHTGEETDRPNRRIFIFDTNGRPQIVEEPPEHLHPITNACQRTHPNSGCFAIGNNHKVTPFLPGGFTKKCPHCNAWLTDFEFNRKSLQCKFCFDGRNAIDELRDILQQYQNTPEYMAHLQDPAYPQYRHFRKESRGYNAQLKFSHFNGGEEAITGGGPTVCRVNGTLDFTLGDIQPGRAQRPRFGNYYAIDPDTAMDLRAQNEDPRIMDRLNRNLLTALDHMLRQDNWLARTYRTAGELLDDYMEAHNGQVPQYRVVFEKRRRGELRDEQGNRLNNPTDIPIAEQPVIIWVDDGTQGPPEDQGIWLENRNGFGYVHIGKWDPLTWPAEYPTIFPRGQLGFRSGLRPVTAAAPTTTQHGRHNDDDSVDIDGADDMDQGQLDDEGNEDEEGATRGDFISLNEYIRYFIPRRGGSSFTTCPHFMWDSGAVTQNFICVARNQVEHRQAEWHRKHQEAMATRSMLRAEHVQYLENRMPEGTRLGKYVYMPRSIPGSKRYMQESFTKLLALENEMGRLPDWFVTCTMDINNPTVLESLRERETPYERPEVVMRIWEEIIAEVKKDLFKNGVLGKCEAWAMVLEHQGRGAPHVHIIMWVADCPGKGTAEWVNKYTSAEFPFPPPPTATGEAADQQRRLCDMVSKLMVHRCNDDGPCMVDGRCTKRFPKQFSEETVIGDGTYPAYRRRAPPEGDELPIQDLNEDLHQYRRRQPLPQDTVEMSPTQRARYGNTVRRRVGNVEYEFDNSRVVPYNPSLLLKYQMHINVEYVGSAAVFDYLCKYLTKGDPLLAVRVERANDREDRVQDYDEFQHHFNANYRTSMQAMARLLGLKVFDMSHCVKILRVHMPGREVVTFHEGDEQHAREIHSPLIAYFRLNQRLRREGDNSADELTYATVNRHFRYINNQWIPRRNRRRNITRVGRAASDHDAEAQALRLLLIHTKAPTSFDDLRRVPGELEPMDTFSEAARRRGLTNDPAILIQTIQDACEELRNPYRRCRFFALLMFHNSPPDTQHIFESVLDMLVPPPPDAQPAQDREARRQRALNRIEYTLQTTFQSSCDVIGLTPPLNYNHERMEEEDQRVGDFAVQPEGGGHVGNDGPERTQRGWQAVVDRDVARMRPQQRQAYDQIMASIRAVKQDPFNPTTPRCFIVEGPGGVGKTLLNNTIIATCKAGRLTVIPTASTGIASTLMIGGATTHSSLWIPTDVDYDTLSRLDAHSALAQRIKSADLIIIDEFSMLHRANLEYIDRQLRDIFPRDGRGRLPFGGIPILLTGNWAQLTPVVVGADDAGRRAASIKSSPLLRHFQTFYLRENMRVGPGESAFANWLLDVGYGQNLISGDCVAIPEQCRATTIDDLIAFCYPADIMRRPIENVDLFKSHCILAPRRDTVERINDRIRELIPEEYSPTEILHGFDHRVRNPTGDDPTAINRAQGEIEYIHNRTPSGFPPYALKLKRGMICIVNRNYDPRAGLYNGTRIQITQILRNLLKVKILTGNTAGQEVYIGRMKFEYGKKRTEPGIPFTRTQYPVEPGFAMTINKAQGQTLERVAVHLTVSQCFSHGMFYTAVSRVRSASSLRILSGLRDKAVNVVDMELIRGAATHLQVDGLDATQMRTTETLHQSDMSDEPMDTTSPPASPSTPNEAVDIDQA